MIEPVSVDYHNRRHRRVHCRYGMEAKFMIHPDPALAEFKQYRFVVT